MRRLGSQPNGCYVFEDVPCIDRFVKGCEELGIDISAFHGAPKGQCTYYRGDWRSYEVFTLVSDLREGFMSHIDFFDIPVSMTDRNWDWKDRVAYDRDGFMWKLSDLEIDSSGIKDETERAIYLVKGLIGYFEKKIKVSRQIDINDVDV